LPRASGAPPRAHRQALVPGSIDTSLIDAPSSARLTVTVSLQGTPITNAWDIWVYPANEQAIAPADVVVARNWDYDTKAELAIGRKVILFPQVVNPIESLPGRFLPVFWSPIGFRNSSPTP